MTDTTVVIAAASAPVVATAGALSVEVSTGAILGGAAGVALTIIGWLVSRKIDAMERAARDLQASLVVQGERHDRAAGDMRERLARVEERLRSLHMD